MDEHKKFVIVFGAAFIFMLLPLLMNFIFISRAYENEPFEEIAKEQVRTDSIYGTVLNQNSFAYKIELLKRVKPAVIALGSSRVMQFREKSFTAAFVNCGGGMNHLNEGKIFIREMLKYHTPELIILGLDFWWFNDNFPQPSSYEHHDNNGAVLTYEKVKAPFKMLNTSKITLEEYFRIIVQGGKINAITTFGAMGLDGLKYSTGFRKDGSYFYAKILFGIEKEFHDPEFKDTLGRIRGGHSRFEYGERISRSRVEEFLDLIRTIERNNIQVVLFVPPVSNTVFKEMRVFAEKYAYVDQFQEYLKKLPYEVYDFHNIERVQSNDCECVDGFHGGDVTYKKILLTILEQNPGSILGKYVDFTMLKKEALENRGKALTIFPGERDKFAYAEVDFLKIGCDKASRLALKNMHSGPDHASYESGVK